MQKALCQSRKIAARAVSQPFLPGTDHDLEPPLKQILLLGAGFSVPPKFDTTSDFPTPLTAHKSFQIKRLGAFDALN